MNTLTTWLIAATVLAALAALVLCTLALRWRRENAEAADAAAEAGRRAQDRLAGVLSITEDAIISIGKDQLIHLFNDGAEKIFGYRREEVLGRPLGMLLPQRFRDAHVGHVEDFRRSEIAARRMGERRELVGLARDGREFPAEASISKLSLEGRDVFTVVLRDISERKRAEQRLLRSERRQRLALEASRLGAFEHDIARGIVAISAEYGEILDFQGRASIEAKEWLGRVHPDDVPRVTEASRRLAAGAGDVDLEFRVRLPGGQEKWIRARGRPEQEGAAVVRTIGVIEDVTAGKEQETRLERAVRERTSELSAMTGEATRQRTLFQSIFEGAPEAIVIADGEGRILMCNRAAATLFGRTAAELVGSECRELCAPATDAALLATLARGMAPRDDGEALEALPVTCRRHPDGEFPAEVIASEIRDPAGRVIGVMTLVRDVTKEREQAENLRKVQRMEAFGQLTGGIAHDFNNLLTVITGNLELLEMRLKEERQLALLKRAQEAAEMGARLTGRLLTFARRRQLETSILDLNAQVLGLSDLLRRTIGEPIDISTVLASRLWPVRADPSEIENAILNLAINARDAMPGGGKLMIETANVTVDPPVAGRGSELRLPAGEYVRLSVSDNGTGMSEATLQRAFEPFFTTKPPGRGTGLGLSSIYGFARQLGGTATIYSEVGQGTTVNIYLPRVPGEGATGDSEPRDQGAAVSAGECVLLVEDNAEVRLVTRARLEELGYKVIEADGGPAALAVLGSGAAIDIVFSDVVMAGGMSGFDVARWLVANRPAMPILLASGHVGELMRTGEKPLDDIRVLRKPYSRLELARALRHALER